MMATNVSRYMEFLFSVVLVIVDAICLGFSNLMPFFLKRKKDIGGEIVLITGGGSGFGQLMTVRFAQLGCRVVIWDVDEEGCRDTIAKVKREVTEAHRVHYYILDVSDRVLVYETAEKVKSEVGDVTILVNNAGIGHSNYFLDTSDALVEKVMNVNTMAHVWTLRAFLPSMVENNHGHLVSMASVTGLLAISRGSAYSASKHAAVGLLDSITLELLDCGKTNVKTTIVCPTFSRTPLLECDYDGILPMVDPEVVVDRVMEGILTNKQVVYVPRSVVLATWLSRFVTKAAILRLAMSLMGEAIMKTAKIRTVFDEQKDQNSSKSGRRFHS